MSRCKLDGSCYEYVDSEEEVVQGLVVQEAAPQKVGAMPNDAVLYESANTQDGDKAQDQARSIKLEFEPNDIKFWFSQLEGEMLLASIGSQWLKKTVLQRNLPNKQKEDVKSYLVLNQQEAGATIYKDIKDNLIRIYAPKPSDSYQKALQRTMTGLPSQLGYQIVDDICKKPRKLVGCCCAGAAQALWSLQIPVNVRAHVSNMEFNVDTYKSVFEAADKVFLSAKQVSIAAVATPSSSNSALDETLSAFTPQNQPQVAAINAQRGRGNGNRGGSGRGGGRNNRGNRGNRGGQNQNQGQSQGSGSSRPKRHASNPPESCCDRHYQFGADCWYCVAPLTCPWVNKVKARP